MPPHRDHRVRVVWAADAPRTVQVPTSNEGLTVYSASLDPPAAIETFADGIRTLHLPARREVVGRWHLRDWGVVLDDASHRFRSWQELFPEATQVVEDSVEPGRRP